MPYRLALLLTVMFASIGLAAEPCEDLQSGSNRWIKCMTQLDEARAEQQLNDTYGALVQELRLAEQTDAEVKLKKAQRAWISFREKDCELQQDAGKGLAGGPDVTYMSCLTHLAAERSKVLEDLLGLARVRREQADDNEARYLKKNNCRIVNDELWCGRQSQDPVDP
jgi:uncharacterized protein YecT (DUF1311 family)